MVNCHLNLVSAPVSCSEFIAARPLRGANDTNLNRIKKKPMDDESDEPIDVVSLGGVLCF